MQPAGVLLLCALSLVKSTCATQESLGGSTITRVVKLLQDMQEKSQADAEQDRALYAKHKCYCDISHETKTNEVASLTETIGLLENNIAALQGANGKASSECAKLKLDMEANEQARKEAEAIRTKEAKAFAALEGDLAAAIEQMKQAIETLSEIGADQTMASAMDHKKFMADYKGASLLKLQPAAATAINAVASLIPAKKQKSIQSLMQAPFTGSYSSQSGAVVGILKEMLDTFTANLQSAKTTESAAIEAYMQFMKAKESQHSEFQDLYESKRELLGTHDEDLSAKRTQLSTSESEKEAAEDFLSELKKLCDKKAQEYQKRVLLRTNEAAAIAKAIAILNSDAAFESFGKVDTTSAFDPSKGTLGFFQMKRSIRSHSQFWNVVRQAQEILERAAAGRRSEVLTRAAMLLQTRNPFVVVLKEMDKMLALLSNESKTDADNLAWCKLERARSDDTISEKETYIDEVTGAIQELVGDIERPKTGLIAMIQEKETVLDDNRASQASETQQRLAENLAYQKDIADLGEAKDLLNRAVEVLRKYYDSLAEKAQGTGLLQSHEWRQPSPPDTWEEYSGQRDAGGIDAIQMLEFIVKQVGTQEMMAHSDENSAQHDFEDSMQTLKTGEKSLEDELATLKETLADKKATLLQTRENLASSTKEKEAVERYLLKIQPGCDFIAANFDDRQRSRETEKTALSKAMALLKASPAYQEAMGNAHQDSLGDCKDVCSTDGENFATCKACLSGVSVPGYCAGHSDTPGCA